MGISGGLGEDKLIKQTQKPYKEPITFLKPLKSSITSDFVVEKGHIAEMNFIISAPHFGILDISGGEHMQFLMRNPMFSSEACNSGAQGAKMRKNNPRTFICSIRSHTWQPSPVPSS